MKKFIKILFAIIILLLITVILLPVIYKNKIINIVKDEVNKNVEAKIDFGDFGLSLISSFPDFTFYIKNVSVINKKPFEGDTLAFIKKLELSVDLMSVIKGKKINIKKIGITEPYIHAIVLKDSTANWDIAIEDTITQEIQDKEKKETTKFKIGLKEYYIKNANIKYDDYSTNTFAEIKNLNHSGEGDFTQDIFDLKTKSDISSITYKMGNIKYLKKASFNSKFDININMPEMKFTFKDNNISLNDLTISFDGYIAMPNDNDIDMDLTFSSSKTDFKSLLSLVPAVYMKDFNNIKSSGKLSLKGNVKGIYNDKKLSAFDLTLLVENASFKYPDLPKSADNINIDLNINNPGDKEDDTKINLKKFHIEMAGNPVDIKMLVKTPVSDPYIDAAINCKLDLSSVKDIIPLDKGEDITGQINSNLTLKGNISALEEERYENFEANGNFTIKNMLYKSASLDYNVALKNMDMSFSPEYVQLNDFDAKVNKSDFKASGRLDNLIAYLMKDNEILKGNLNLKSNYIDLNEFMSDEDSTSAVVATDSLQENNLEVFEVPGNINFSMQTNINKMLYDNIEIQNIKGQVLVYNKRIDMSNLTMELLKGNTTMNGSYSTQDINNPDFSFKMDIKNFDVTETGEKFNTVEKIAPIVKSCKGKYSAVMEVAGKLDKNMEPVLNTLNGRGKLITNNISIEDFKPLVKVAETLKQEKFKKIVFNDVDINFSFKDGKIYVDPFDVKIGNIKATIAGSNSFDQSIDYVMLLEIPRSEFAGEANAVLENLVKQANAKGADFSLSDIVKIKVRITGTVSDPKISTDFKKDVIKENLKEELKKKKEEVVQKAKEQLEKKKQEARKKAKEEAEKIIKEAKKMAEKIRNEAKNTAEKIRKEGYAQADKLEQEAKNPIAKVAAKKAADKLRKETDKKAQKVIDEANKRAENILKNARKKADEILKQ